VPFCTWAWSHHFLLPSHILFPSPPPCVSLGSPQERLTALFPDGRAFLHLGRFLLRPNNKIWLRITRYHSSYLAHHNRLVGIQV